MSIVGELLPARPETIAMRNLGQETRDRLISEASNVVDLRPKFNFMRRQRALAESYRKGGPKGKGPTRA